MLRSRRRGPLGTGGRERLGWGGALMRRLRWVALAVGVLFLIAIGAAVLQQSSRAPAPPFPGAAAVSPVQHAQLRCCALGGGEGKRGAIVRNPGPPGSPCLCPGQGTGFTCR